MLMKRLRNLLSSLVMMLLITVVLPGAPLPAQASAENPDVFVNGAQVQFPDTLPYISHDRTMVPVAAPMRAMGCQVTWIAKSQQAIISNANHTAIFTIGSTSYLVDNVKKGMDVAPEIANNRTAFPIRFAAEAMGATVAWDAGNSTVNITTQSTITMKAVVKKTTLGTNVLTDILPPSGVDRIKVVCTSNPELNTLTTKNIAGQTVSVDKTHYTSDYILYNAGFSNNPEPGEQLTFDIYAKINGTELKIDAVTFTVPSFY